MKRLLAVILALSMLPLALPSMASGNEIKVFVDGEQVAFDAELFIENDRTLVPMRAIFEALGASLIWNGQFQTISVVRDDYDYMLIMEIGSKMMTFQAMNLNSTANDGMRAIQLDVPAKIVNDRTFVPLRAVSEAFDCDVKWDADTKTVTIASAGQTNKSKSFEEELLSRMSDDKNYMISPFSLKMVLAMAANGADGDTKKEILETLGINDINEFNEYIQSFFEYLETAQKTNAEKGEFDIDLPVFEAANSVWINKDYKKEVFGRVKFADSFSKIISDYYNGESGIVGDDDKVSVINGWVNEKTHGKIQELIDDDTEFLAALINAVYMKASWEMPFDESATRKDKFTDRNGSESELDFMNETAYYKYYADDDIQLVEIPYYGGLSMYVALGDALKFRNVKNSMEVRNVALSLPKFKTETTTQFRDILVNMGINKAFAKTGAKFPNMLTPTPALLWLDYVIQKTYINVDENGTEAAAVTMGAMVGAGSVQPPEPVEFKADRPFTYFITDDETGQIFFMGEYAYAE